MVLAQPRHWEAPGSSCPRGTLSHRLQADRARVLGTHRQHEMSHSPHGRISRGCACPERVAVKRLVGSSMFLIFIVEKHLLQG
jgi:hypothetical protein